MTATVTDLFCGAGGSSLGAEAAGMHLTMAANHWDTAIDVHQANFPDAGHDCADISQVDPRRYPRTDVLLASPECTNHSQARGVSRKKQDLSLFDAPDPAAERSRATMWDVPRFAEQLRYDAIVVENVVEATNWVGWRGWSQVMADLGYERTVLSHNSMHHGVPQSRDRIYVVFWRKGLQPDLELELQAWCPTCEAARPVRQAWKNGRTVGRYRQQWVCCCTTCGDSSCDPDARPAAEIIDWSLDCPRIGDRKRPLAKATRKRILAGLERYGWVPATADAPAPAFLASITRTARAQGGLGALDEPMRTQTAQQEHGLVVPMRRNGRARGVDEPLPTVAANGNHHGLLMRNNGGGAEMVTPLEEPARTITTKGHQSLLVPYYGNGQAQPTGQPMPTVTTRDRCALVDVEAVVDDCGFRMLEPHEIAAAMAFPDGYIPDHYTKKDRVKLAGNAVTPPVMQWITGRLLQALEQA